MKKQGLSLMEVVIAVAILGILSTVLTTTLVSNLRRTSTAGQTSQVVPVLDFLSVLVARGDARVLSGAETIWAYGQLPALFTDISGGINTNDLARYRARVTIIDTVAIGAAESTIVELEVCFNDAGADRCVTGRTLANAANRLGVN